MGRKLMVFKPRSGKTVRMYTCGPTVWNYAHVGNFRTFIFEDVLRRYLKFKGFKVIHVMNITDVEDNIIKGMKEFHMSRKELTSHYEKAFMDDLASLNAEKAEFYPRATENIPEMLALIERLMLKGYAYKSPDGSVYYDISKFKKYGRLSGVVPRQLKTRARVSSDHYAKEEANDFALWKAWDAEDGEVYWETGLGKGRPGWHIECSAMSMKYLGESFDIHTGGIDNKFPHHENEIAQSEAATGRKFVNYWLHSNFLSVSGAEMHKSSGNFITLRELLAGGWNPRTVRFFLISTRYRDPADLNDEALRQADAGRSRIQEMLRKISAISVPGEPGAAAPLVRTMIEGFTSAMDDDLNTPRALAAIFDFVKEINVLLEGRTLRSGDSKVIQDGLKEVDGVLGVLEYGAEALPESVRKLLAERDDARRRKDFATSDRIRDELLKTGIFVQDTPSGTVWRRKTEG